MNLGDVYSTAAAMIRKQGWWQGDGTASDPGSGGKLCIVVAVGTALSGLGMEPSTVRDDVYQLALNKIKQALGVRPSFYSTISLFEWNDNPQRQEAEVTSLLESLAAVERARGDSAEHWDVEAAASAA